MAPLVTFSKHICADYRHARSVFLLDRERLVLVPGDLPRRDRAVLHLGRFLLLLHQEVGSFRPGFLLLFPQFIWALSTALSLSLFF